MTTHAPTLYGYFSKEAAGLELSEDVLAVVDAIATSCARISHTLRTAAVAKVQKENEFGDEVLTVDLAADKAIAEELHKCRNVGSFSSEEHPDLILTEHGVAAAPTATPGTAHVAAVSPDLHRLFCVTFDPLDGSSVIDTNFAVGSIFAVWPGLSPIGRPCADIAVSAVCQYGPRTSLFVALGPGKVFEFLLFGSTFHLAHTQPCTVAPKASIFAPGNLRAVTKSPNYRRAVDSCVKGGMTLRYTGGMVPDVLQILVKGNGIFVTPKAEGFKVKLRVCFECGPLAHLVECAGGLATDCERRYRDVVVTKLDQRSAIIIGSKETVQHFHDTIDAPVSKL